MTFDPYANQGDTSAWDPEAAAATKRAADKIFTDNSDAATSDSASETANEAGADTGADENDTTEADNPSGEGSGTAVKQDPHAPEDVPDPDITPDP
jgi:hypothetical protein